MKDRNKLLDQVNMRILQILQREGRISNRDLAARVELSPATVLRRVRKLREHNIIHGFQVLVDLPALGFQVLAFVTVQLHRNQPGARLDFAERVKATPSVRECWLLTGPVDALLRCVTPDQAAFDALLDSLAAMENVKKVTALTPLQQTKGLPLAPLEFFKTPDCPPGGT